MTETKTKDQCCAAQVAGYGGYRFHPYGKPGKVEEAGRWYCGTHDPIKRRAKSDATQAAWEAKFTEDRRRRNLADAAPQMLAALKEIYAGTADHQPGHVCYSENRTKAEIGEIARAAIARAT